MAFSDRKVLLLSEQKVTVEVFVLMRLLFVTTTLTTTLRRQAKFQQTR